MMRMNTARAKHGSRIFTRLGVGVMMAGMVPPVARTHAQPITVTNPSFENNFAGPNSFPVLIPQGWQLYDPSGIVDQNQDAVGVLHPSGGTFFTNGAPDGTNVALVFLNGDIGGGPVGLSQPLAATLQANRRYTLTVQVGNIASGVGAPPFNQFFNLQGFPGYAVQLLAANQVIAADNNTLFGQIPEGEFRLSSVVAAIPAFHPLIGGQLRVRVINLNVAETPANPGIEVDFDDVRLSSAAYCVADFNNASGVGVQDIFDFLAAWFASSPTADVNGLNGVTVQDIFDFLAAWFAGC